MKRVFQKLHQNYWILFIPIAIDLGALIIGLNMIGFYGEPQISFQVILDVGLPSLSHILSTPLFVNSIKIFNLPQGISEPTPLIFLLFIVISAFSKGGLIGILYKVSQNQSIHFNDFLTYGKRFVIKFVIWMIIVNLAITAISLLFMLLFGVMSYFLVLFILIILRVLFIYVEFVFVVERAGFGEAFSLSRQYLKQSAPSVYMIIGLMFLFAGSISWFVYMFWMPLVLFLSIPVYAYVMCIVYMALMMSLNEAKNN